MIQEVTRLSGSVAEGLSHGDVAHSWRTAWLSVIQGLNPPGGSGIRDVNRKPEYQEIRCFGYS